VENYDAEEIARKAEAAHLMELVRENKMEEFQATVRAVINRRLGPNPLVPRCIALVWTTVYLLAVAAFLIFAFR
jgi:hypothetical protein